MVSSESLRQLPGRITHTKKYRLRAQSGRHMTVELVEPTEGEECLLTLEPIVEDKLDFLPAHSSFIEDSPNLQKMLLPCGHGFGALNIMYHFARNKMLCPCCRTGISSSLTGSCVPRHIKQVYFTDYYVLCTGQTH